MLGLLADYPYPKDEKGVDLDTCEYRDPCKIDYHAPKSHEKGAPDNDLFKAVRGADLEAFNAAVAAGADINAKDKVRAPATVAQLGWRLPRARASIPPRPAHRCAVSRALAPAAPCSWATRPCTSR